MNRNTHPHPSPPPLSRGCERGGGSVYSSRRKFFSNAARVGIVGSIVALGAVLLSRVKPARAVNCERKSVCDICSDVFTCVRPEAKNTAAALVRDRAHKFGAKR